MKQNTDGIFLYVSGRRGTRNDEDVYPLATISLWGVSNNVRTVLSGR